MMRTLGIGGSFEGFFMTVGAKHKDLRPVTEKLQSRKHHEP